MATRKTADTKTKVGVQKTVSKASTDVVTAGRHRRLRQLLIRKRL